MKLKNVCWKINFRDISGMWAGHKHSRRKDKKKKWFYEKRWRLQLKWDKWFSYKKCSKCVTKKSIRILPGTTIGKGLGYRFRTYDLFADFKCAYNSINRVKLHGKIQYWWVFLACSIPGSYTKHCYNFRFLGFWTLVWVKIYSLLVCSQMWNGWWC